MLDLRARKQVSRAADPLARSLARLGLSPMMITILGLVATLAGSVLIAAGRLTAGAAIVGFGAILDVLDGVLARISGTESLRGAFLDSFTDRVGEVAMWTGLAFYLGQESQAELVLASIVAVCGSLLTPYLRAKAESFDVEGKGGFIGRAERLILFCVGVGLAGVGLPILEITVWVLAGLTWLTVLQRFFLTWGRLG